MQFNSFIFILLFLPLSLIGYFGLQQYKNGMISKVFLLLMSLWFYGYFNYSYLLIILTSISVNFLLARYMNIKHGNKKKALMILGITFNVALIFYFKYFNFFVDNINALFRTDIVIKEIVLPLGISFFTFQQISYLIDAYRGETSGYTFLEYALFVSFFPQLVAGPIVLHTELIPQFRDKTKRKFDPDNISKGIMQFSRGLGKKMLIADAFGKAVTWGFGIAALHPSGENALTVLEIIVIMLSYTFQIYFDFSGYSDMAAGLGQMFNFDIPMNFNSPYKALSITDFWKRWHITLTRFLTNYVYIPLGGSRKGKKRTYINIMIVFLISGVWHGANWTFILWGMFHGIGQCINRFSESLFKKHITKIHAPLPGNIFIHITNAVKWLVTFAFVNITWLLFRSDSVSQWITIIKRLSVPDFGIRMELLENFKIPRLRYALSALNIPYSDNGVLLLGLLLLMSLAFILCLCFKNNYERLYRKNVFSLVITYGILVTCILSLSHISTFLYFNF